MARSVDDLLRPSNLYKVLACPASAAREAECEETTSDAAQEGIAAHQIAAAALGEGKRARDYVGTVVDGVTCTAEMADAVQVYLDYVHQLRQGTKPFVELRVEFHEAIGIKSGTTDCALQLVHDNVLHVIDYKHGRGVTVSAERNPQLMAYALGLVDYWEPFIDDIDNLKVHLHIVQPRALFEPDVYRTDVRELMDFEKQVKAAVEEAKGFTPRYQAGSHCRFCLVKANCEAFRGFVRSTVDESMSHKNEITPITDLAEDMNRVEAVRIWCNAIEAEVTRLLKEGMPVPGWRLVAGRGSRKFKDDAEVIALAKRKRMNIDTYMPRELASVAALEKALGHKQFVKYGFPLLVEKFPGQPTLAKDNDQRADYTRPNADDFDDLDDPLLS